MNQTSALWRVFVAAWPDDALLDALAPVDRWLKQAGAHRIIPRAQRHVTLAFLGDVTPDVIDPLGASLRTALAASAPISMSPASIIALPSPSAPRVIACALTATPEWAALRRCVLEAVEIVTPTDSVKRDLMRDAAPHITVARSRRRERARRLDLTRAPQPEGSIDIDEIRVLRSVLTPAGPEYTVIERARVGRTRRDQKK